MPIKLDSPSGQAQGEWTPRLTALTTPPTGVTYDLGMGVFWKLGTLVIAGFSIDLASIGAGGVGPVSLTGLPSAGQLGGFASACKWENITITGFTSVSVASDGGTTASFSLSGTGGASALQWSALQANSRVQGWIIYL